MKRAEKRHTESKINVSSPQKKTTTWKDYSNNVLKSEIIILKKSVMAK